MKKYRAIRRPRVLVIDDDLVIAATLMIILERAGFEAISAKGSFPGLHLAWSWRPDILLTDFDMPGLNCIDVTRRICAIVPGCRLFLLSGHSEAGRMAAEARREGYEVELLNKPIHPADLLARLRRIVDMESLHSPQEWRQGDPWN
jgi:DNA-binding NtrC family response regulator